MKKNILPFVMFLFVSLLSSCSKDTIEETVKPQKESPAVKDTQLETGNVGFPDSKRTR